MSKSPFQNIPPETAECDVAPLPVRRLQSPAERFSPAEIARDAEKESAEESSAERASNAAPRRQSASEAGANTSASASIDSALKPSVERAPDAFQALPREAEERARRPARARRQVQPHAPNHHQKQPRQVAHKAINPAPETEPTNEWDRAAQNSMARAALARKKGRTRRILGRILLASGTLFAVWAGAMALTAPQFEVEKVETSGLDRTPQKRVEELTSQLVGRNVFRAPRARIESEIEALPTVANARLVRAWSWPPHMKLKIAERQPILQVGAGANWWVADAQGVAYRRADRRDDHLDKLAAPQFQPVTGQTLPAAPWKRARELEAALAADNALAAQSSGDKSKFWDLRRVYLDKNGAAALRVGDEGALKQHAEMLIRLGEEDWPKKLKQARMALAFFERTGRQASELDLISGEHPRWLPKVEDETETQLARAENVGAEDIVQNGAKAARG